MGEPIFVDTTHRNNEAKFFMVSAETNITNILVCFQTKTKLVEDKEILDKGSTGCESATIVFCPFPTTNNRTSQKTFLKETAGAG